MKQLFLCSILPVLLSASIIPQSGFTGRPGDGTCRDCHPAKSVVPHDSSVILGLPETLSPETVYPCTLVIRYKGLSEWTFSLATSDSVGNQMGSLNIIDSIRTQVDTLEGILYLKNTLRGASIGKPDSARWAFEYVSPPAGCGPIGFYWSAYIKNRKESTKKYFILENSLILPEATAE